jgi:ribosome-associated protein
VADGDVLEVGAERPIPVSEVELRFSRAGGPGGQHVNTSSTRVEAVFDVSGSPSLNEGERERALEQLGPRLDSEGRLRVVARNERSQRRNRDAALRRMSEMLRHALAPPPPPRRKTRPTKASAERRIAEKKHSGQVKRLRRPPQGDD